jgi:4-hydroxy-L-threonine phosphate dehydrogenase PdxA
MTAPQTFALAIGDPNGIGPEIAVKSLERLGPADPRVVLVGDRHVVDHYAGDRIVRSVVATDLPAAEPGIIDVIDVPALESGDFAPGGCSARSGAATVAYLDAALVAARQGAFGAVLGCPHNETAVNAAGIAFTGYPGLVARLSGVAEDAVFLMLVGGGLRIVHVTLHERLADALARIDRDCVERAVRSTADALSRLGIETPRIGIFGINPHAGENGLFGDDDRRITAPVAESLRAQGLRVEGPGGADLLLLENRCDAYVAMYHDQGHIPIKLLAGRESSALTIGAGTVFASVGHGSAPDIAGRNLADPTPLVRTIRLIAGSPVIGTNRS